MKKKNDVPIVIAKHGVRCRIPSDLGSRGARWYVLLKQFFL